VVDPECDAVRAAGHRAEDSWFRQPGADEPQRVRALGVLYALGVLVSFLALAGLVIGVKAAGHRAGWGMQFGNPQFLVVLTVLVTLVALNLFGLLKLT